MTLSCSLACELEKPTCHLHFVLSIPDFIDLEGQFWGSKEECREGNSRD